jgi:molecular chaperone DnaJ
MRSSRRPPDAYALLGLAPGATRAEIRRAYRKRAMQIHPDVADRDTTAEMADLNAARDRLIEHAAAGAVPGPNGNADGDGSSPSDPAAEPAFTHAPVWDDYWAAWNDPPRRGRP